MSDVCAEKAVGRDKARPTELNKELIQGLMVSFHKAVIRSRSGGHASSLRVF